MEIKNLCPHDVRIQLNYKETIIIPASGIVARLRWGTEFWKTVNGIPIHTRFSKGVDNLPPERKGVLYLVSNLLQEKLADEREDLVAPDRYTAHIYPDGNTKSVDRLVRWIC